MLSRDSAQVSRIQLTPMRSIRVVAALPLEQRSPDCLLIARNAQPSKHSQRYVYADCEIALCDEGGRQPERKRTIEFA